MKWFTKKANEEQTKQAFEAVKNEIKDLKARVAKLEVKNNGKKGRRN